MRTLNVKDTPATSGTPSADVAVSAMRTPTPAPSGSACAGLNVSNDPPSDRAVAPATGAPAMTTENAGIVVEASMGRLKRTEIAVVVATPVDFAAGDVDRTCGWGTVRMSTGSGVATARPAASTRPPPSDTRYPAAGASGAAGMNVNCMPTPEAGLNEPLTAGSTENAPAAAARSTGRSKVTTNAVPRRARPSSERDAVMRAPVSPRTRNAARTGAAREPPT